MESSIDALIRQHLGARIRHIRMQKGMKQQELAQRCGFYKSGLSNIESGGRNLSIVNLYKIALALEEPVSRFFRDEDYHEVYLNHRDTDQKPS